MNEGTRWETSDSARKSIAQGGKATPERQPRLQTSTNVVRHGVHRFPYKERRRKGQELSAKRSAQRRRHSRHAISALALPLCMLFRQKPGISSTACIFLVLCCVPVVSREFDGDESRVVTKSPANDEAAQVERPQPCSDCASAIDAHTPHTCMRRECLK